MIFDTEVLIWFFRGDQKAAKLMELQAERAVSIISLMELLQGARSGAEIRVIRRFFPDNGFRVIPVNESISHLAATLMEDHALKDGLRVADALIAATARETASVLATGNVRHFRAIAGLELKRFRPTATSRNDKVP
jgi:predicted nucleic acid-binding protein